MTIHKFTSLKTILAVVCVSTAMIIPGSISQIKAQPEQEWLVSVKFPPSDETVGTPGRSTGTGSRGACDLYNHAGQPNHLEHNLENSVTAIVPKNNIGTTVVPNPNIYIYVTETYVKDAEFLLIDPESEEEVVIYNKNFTLPDTPAIVKITLPETVELKLNRTERYKWYFGVICDANDRSADEGIYSSLRRTTLSPEQAAKIEQARQQPLVQARLYAEAGIWQEALDILAQEQERNPQVEAEWQELLDSVGLGVLAQYPIVDCCSQP